VKQGKEGGHKKETVAPLSRGAKWGIAAAVAVFLFGVVCAAYAAGWFEGVSLSYMDLLFNIRGRLPARDDIVLVSIDTAFKKKFRRTNAPVSREFMGKILDALRTRKAGVVLFDRLFLKPCWSEKGDALFSAAIERAWDAGIPVIVGAMVDPEEGLQEPIEALAGADVGIINLRYDRDKVVRRYTPFYGVLDPNDIRKTTWVPSLAVQAFRYKKGISPDRVSFGKEYAYKMGSTVIRDSDIYINFTGGRYNFRTVSALDLIEGRVEKGVFEGAVVIVADMTPESQDFFAVPFMKPARVWSEELDAAVRAGLAAGGKELKGTMPGAEIHANAFQSLLEGSWVRRVPRGWVIAVLAAVGIAGAFLFFSPGLPAGAAAAAAVLAVGAEAAVSHGLFLHHVFMDAVPLILLTLLYAGGGFVYKNFILARANRKVADVFGRYVSANIVEKILAEGIDISLGGQTADVTVLFSDIRGFTPISEKLSPEEIARLLNTYFSAMIKVVFAHDGTLDKLMGDAIMAFFGDPVKFDDHPHKACRTALSMLAELEKMKRNPPVKGIEMVEIGIGINTGKVTVGDLGSFEFRDYTVIGDNVNLGSRLEGMNKVYGTHIITSEFTRERAADAFEFRRLDAVRVKGKTHPVTIYELVGETGKVDPARLERVRRFEKALDLYVKGDFGAALEMFEHLREEGDPPAETFRARCRRYLEESPPPDWDGVYTATSK